MNSPLPSIAPNEILSRLFVGAVVDGVRFGVLQLLFDNPSIDGEPYLNLASHWEVFAERPSQLPELGSAPTEETPEHELGRAIELRHRQVSAVEVLAPWPHLVMTFTDGTVLFLNGKNAQYEPWTAGLAHTPRECRIEVIACPGGELAFILPEQPA